MCTAGRFSAKPLSTAQRQAWTMVVLGFTAHGLLMGQEDPKDRKQDQQKTSPSRPGTQLTTPSQPPAALSPPDHLCTGNTILQSWFSLGEDGSSSRSCLPSSSACPAGYLACTCAPSLPDRCNHQPWALRQRRAPSARGKANPSVSQRSRWQNNRITCFGVADVTGLFEDMSGCQRVLHQQGCVGHYWFWLGQQVLGDFGHSWVTHSTKADLHKTTHTSLLSSATTRVRKLHNPTSRSSLPQNFLIFSLIKAFQSEMTFPKKLHASLKKITKCCMFTSRTGLLHSW